MIELRRAAALYIAVLALGAAALAAVGLTQASQPEARRLALAVGLAALMTLVYCFPLDFAHRTKLTLDSSVIFVAVLLFQPGPAMLIVAGGTLLAHALRREPWVQAAFNTSQTALQAGLGALLLAAVGWDPNAPRFDEPGLLAVIGLAAAGMYLINTSSVSVIVGLQSRLSPWGIWRQSAGFDAPEELAQLALGLLTAAMVDVHLWTLPLLLVLGFAVYLSLERHISLRRQTLDAVEALADIVDLRDPYTADHSCRVAGYARELATALGLPPDEVSAIETAARVHDVGKVVIDRDVLAQRTPLQEADWGQLREHPLTGERIVSRFPQFAAAARYVRGHHERWDGTGYPDGLSGELIPLGARVIAVADALDAMVHARPFRPALPSASILRELEAQRGLQWDTQIIDALMQLLAEGRIALPADAPVADAREGDMARRAVVA
jgi:HD-GYP domain-containing protein (c-di-GMP phosphodiesterase class II)